MEKYIAGQSMYNDGIPQKEIARVLDVSEQTVVTWKKKYNWDEKKEEKILRQSTAEDIVWELVIHNLKVLKRRKDKWETEDPETDKMIDKGDSDSLTKLFSTIKGKQMEWSTYVKIIREFVEHIQTNDQDLAQKILEVSDSFLNIKRKEL